MLKINTWLNSLPTLFLSHSWVLKRQVRLHVSQKAQLKAKSCVNVELQVVYRFIFNRITRQVK